MITIAHRLSTAERADRVAVLESNRAIEVGPNWLVNKVRRYGSTVVTLITKGAT